MRANDKNLTIVPYVEYHQLDSTKIKIKEPNHLFDIDPNNRKSTKRTYVDRDAASTTESPPSEVQPPTNVVDDVTVNKAYSPTIEQLIEQKEKAKGIKRQKLFEYDDEW